jgi:hypothetical protein
MRTLILEGLLRSKTQIAHNGGEINGNISAFRRFKVVQPSGKIVEIPHVSGNSIRGKLRDVAAKQMLDILGDENAPLKVDIKVFQLLFSGGSLGAGNNADDIEKYRQMRENLVHVSLFGGAWGNAILSGKMKVNPLLPIAKETAHIIPKKWHGIEDLPSIFTYLQLEMFTRKENSNDAEFQPYIQRSEDVQYSTSQMIYHVETISAGTPFYWKVVLEDVTPEEFDFFLSVIQKFKNIPVVGGKSATGFGQIEFEDISWRDVTKDGDILTDIEETTESLYVNFVKNNKNGIKAYLKMI